MSNVFEQRYPEKSLTDVLLNSEDVWKTIKGFKTELLPKVLENVDLVMSVTTNSDQGDELFEIAKKLELEIVIREI